MEEKKLNAYYQKPIKKLKDCKVGDYVYDDTAELCYVDICSYMPDKFVLKSYGIEKGYGDEHVVYPITLETARIMDKMSKHRHKWHEAHIMNGFFSVVLSEKLHCIMKLDPNSEDYYQKTCQFWTELDEYYEEMLGHAKALHLC